MTNLYTADAVVILSVSERTDEGWKMIGDTWNSDMAPTPAAQPAAAQ